jgi:HEAT repeat protein
LGEADAGARVEAASLLWRMDKNAKEVVPTLAALLSNPETAYDYRTIKLLGQIGPPAKEAIPALKVWLKTKRMPEAFVTNAAVEALQRIGAEP